MYVFKEFTPESVIALIESDIKRYSATVEDRRIGKEFQRGKIAALTQLKWVLENCRVERCDCDGQYGQHCRDCATQEVEFPDGVFWESRD